MKTLSHLRALSSLPFVAFRRSRVFAILAAISTFPAQAILDTNSNGLSDLWEKQHNNGNLFPNTFFASNDEDQDGWTNAQEAAAATDPFNPNPPDGIVTVTITPSITLGAFTITWPTLVGKNYQLKVSTDLTTWTILGEPITTNQTTHSIGINTIQPDTTIPPKVFWQVVVTDLDSDLDGLTNSEENALGTNPNLADSDGDTLNDKAEILASTNPLDEDTDEDGLNDNLDLTPLQNDALADPDGTNLATHLNNYTTATNGVRLIARYDFEALPVGANNDFPSSIPTVPAAVAQNIGLDRFANPSGMPSFCCQWNAAPTANEYLSLPHQILNERSQYTWSYWLKLPPNAFVASAQNTGIRSLLSIGINRYAPSVLGTSSPLPALHWYCDIATGKIRAETYQIQIGTPAMLGSGWDIPAAWNDGEWHHIVLHKNDANYKIYFDGADLGNRTSNNIDVPLSTNSYTLIGRRDLTTTTQTNTAFCFPPGSRLDRLRCYTALTQADVTALYNHDIDRDGLHDRTESRVRYWIDRNANGIRNADESDYVQRPFHHDAIGTDHDRDGIASHTEQASIIKTNASLPDSDGDLMLDGWELANGLNPLVNDAAADKDLDRVSNIDEYRYASNANNTDSDGDGTSDATEISQGSHPNDARDGGQPIPVSDKLPILLGVGDESSSRSEDYVINCFRINPDTGAEIPYYVLRSGGQGQYAEQTINIFRKEDTYTFQIKWISSSLQQKYNDGEPDFDYTFKVSSGGSASTGKFLDSYDCTRRLPTPGHPIRGINVNDKYNFLAEIEIKRVALVNLKLKWEAYPTFDNIENHIDPWTKQEEGKRIFPDFLDPTTNELRDKARIQISNGLPNIEVKVKSFDVDDSTSENFDKHYKDNYTIIDHTPYGNDNFSSSNSSFSKHGYLWNENKWNAAPIVVICDEQGKKAVDFKVSMHPGDNYRVCAELLPVQVIDQVTVDSVMSPHSLGFAEEERPNIPTSDSLTVWRQLWLEDDSMEAIPLDGYGYKMNNLKPIGNTVNSILNTLLLENGNTKIQITALDDYSSAPYLENAKLIVDSQNYNVYSHFQSTEVFEVSGDQTAFILPQMEFRLYDDDDYGIIGNVFPVTETTENIRPLFKSAFIELRDGFLFNSRKTIPFYRNHGPIVGTPPFNHPGIFDDSKDLTSTEALWVANLVYAYQANLSSDKDPKNEDALEGATPSNRSYSIVYCEAVREILDDLMRNPRIDNANLNSLLKRNIYLTAAHEIGHMPGSGNETEHHSENFLMEDGYSDDEETNIFSPQTIKRFRSTTNWQQP